MREGCLTRRSSAALGLSAALLLALSLGGCGKQSAQPPASAPAANSASNTAGPSTATAPSSTPAARTPASGASPNAGEADEATDGPELPDTVDGTPTMMSEDAFLSAYRELEGVIVLADGLMYRVIASGKGRSPKAADKVRVNYKGSLMDGSVFDQTKPGAPVELELAKTIAGWREALPLMKEGDKWEIVIPSDLAYGEKGHEGIAPNSPLVFEIELVQVVKS